MDFKMKEQELQDRCKKICGRNKLSSELESPKMEKSRKFEESSKERDKLQKELLAAKSGLSGIRKSLVDANTRRSLELEHTLSDTVKEKSPFSDFKFSKHQPAQLERVSKEKAELEIQLENKKKEIQEKQKKMFELQEKVSQIPQLESKLEEKRRRLEAFNKERDILERELITTRSELTGIKRTLGNFSDIKINDEGIWSYRVYNL